MTTQDDRHYDVGGGFANLEPESTKIQTESSRKTVICECRSRIGLDGENKILYDASIQL